MFGILKGFSKEYRTIPKGVPDLLNYGFLVDEGIIIDKERKSFLTAFYFRGNDLGSSTDEELNVLAAQANQALTKLEPGWLCHVDSIRITATTYPSADQSFFPDATTALIDAERRIQHESAGTHYDTVYGLTLNYEIPGEIDHLVSKYFVTDPGTKKGKSGSMNLTNLLDKYKATVASIIDSMPPGIHLRHMSSDELITYIHSALTGENHSVQLAPKVPVDIDGYVGMLVGSKGLVGGLEPTIGERHITAIKISGFPGAGTPGLLDVLNRMPIEYRFNNRFIPLGTLSAERQLKKARRNWSQKVVGFLGSILSGISGGSVTPSWADSDASNMAQDADIAINENREGLVRFGWYTPCIIIMAESAAKATEHAREVIKLLGNAGFGAERETINTLEAYLGSLPGHAFENPRKVLMHSRNLADMLPLTAVWTGHKYNPCPFYPPKSPPLLHASTTGATPFRLSLHVSDLGHFAIIGPSGAGKSTLLNLIQAQHFRYPDAQLFGFDFGYSMATLCEASGGAHYDIGSPELSDAPIGFCPLAQIDTSADRSWAAGFIELLVTLRSNSTLTVNQTNEIRRAINALANDSNESSQRTLTHFQSIVQDNEIKDALRQYTIGSGAIGDILDADRDELTDSGDARCFVFEMSHLFDLGEHAIIPVMMHIFRQIEKRVAKSIPTLITIDEAFRSFGHPLAIDRLNKWLETMRKENAAVGFATQNIETVLKSEIGTSIIQTTATKILLPNPQATTQIVSPLYRALGLNEREIMNLAYARSKRDYYMMNNDGKRMFELGLGSIALAFVGAGGLDQMKHIRKLKKEYGEDWVPQYLREKGISDDWINTWREIKESVEVRKGHAA